MNRAHAPAQALLLAACAWLPACGLNQAGVAPPPDTIAYPASAVLDRTGDWLFVTNSNADLRYNDGTLIALSLVRAGIDRDPKSANFAMWQDCPQVDDPNPRSDDKHKCCWDALDSNILNCDERFYVGPDGAEGDGSGNVRIGSFAAGMVRQEAQCPTGCSCTVDTPDDRLLLGVRGDTSLTFIDVDTSMTAPGTPPPMKCVTDPSASPIRDRNAPVFPSVIGDFETCDADHRIIQANTQLAAPMENPKDSMPIPLPDEPYALVIDYDNGLLFIGHLTGSTARPYSGGFSLFDIAPLGPGLLAAPRFVAPFPSPFPATSLGSVGITAMSVQEDDVIGHVVFASSRYVPEVAGLGTTATCPEAGTPTREIAAYPNGRVYSSPLGGSAETRGIQFVTVREPKGAAAPACNVGDRASCMCANGVSGVQTCGADLTYGGCVCSGGAFVLQRNPPSLIRFDEASAASTDMLETCGSPTFLDQHDSGLGPRLFVTCFADGEVDVFDPAVPTLEKTFMVGRGPSGLVFDTKRPVAYVVGFGDNNISVVDLTPGSHTEYHVIQRLGFPRTAPR